MNNAGARRGLALRTRRAYGQWVARFGASAGSANEAQDEAVARERLEHLVTTERLAFSTQKQALNALAFYFRDVCGREKVDLRVVFRKTEPRVPVVFNVKEVVALIERLEAKGQVVLGWRPRWRTDRSYGTTGWYRSESKMWALVVGHLVGPTRERK